MFDWLSLAYGSMVGLVDWNVTENYVGPDLMLIPIRNVYPQPVTSFADMNYCQVVTEMDREEIKKLQPKDGWRNIDRFLEITRDQVGTTPSDKAADEMSYNDQLYNAATQNSKRFPRFRIITEYRRDRWIVYAPDQHLILRDIPNPHKNNQLPLVIKYCIPQIDFVFGLSEVEIGASMAELLNSLYNLAIDDAKLQLYPPLVVSPDSVVPATIRMGAAKLWVLNDKNSRAPEPFISSTRGSASALEMRQMAIGALQSLSGSSDTSVKSTSDYSLGKTPQALKMQEARQSSRDDVDRFYMEQFISEVNRRFANLIVQ